MHARCNDTFKSTLFCFFFIYMHILRIKSCCKLDNFFFCNMKAFCFECFSYYKIIVFHICLSFLFKLIF
uniref:Uncharacterized protein n=1 Tax=Staphylococcus aureus TaxID=1280 RepID=Q9XB78_STAAU|nr:hypothetical protein [Staphylococcus aureus]BAB47626.1 hypothetical protein [Staphylococcus aureus]